MRQEPVHDLACPAKFVELTPPAVSLNDYAYALPATRKASFEVPPGLQQHLVFSVFMPCCLDACFFGAARRRYRYLDGALGSFQRLWIPFFWCFSLGSSYTCC